MKRENILRQKVITYIEIIIRYFLKLLADLTVSKRPGTSNRIEIHFAVVNHLYLCFSFLKLAETL